MPFTTSIPQRSDLEGSFHTSSLHFLAFPFPAQGRGRFERQSTLVWSGAVGDFLWANMMS